MPASMPFQWRKTPLFFLLIVALAASCKKKEPPSAPECCDTANLGEYLLLTGSRNSIPYQADTTLYFRDASNNEIMFTLRNSPEVYTRTDQSTTRRCPCNQDFDQIINASGDAFHFLLKQPDLSLDLSFLLNLHTQPFHGQECLVADVLEISVQDKNDTGSYGGVLRILVDPRNLTGEYLKWYRDLPVDSIELLGSTFYDVYSDANNEVWYNFEDGLVAFSDRQDKLWVLDRVEEE